MKHILFLVGLLLCFLSKSQVLNGSFQNGNTPSLSNWQWSCGAQSFSNSPILGGNWSIQVASANSQGCFPGYAYQKIPSISNGQSFQLSGWAYAEITPTVGIYFGKINGSNITLQAGSTTTSTTWINLIVQSAFSLNPGDTAIVLLNAGLTGGPSQGYGHFDLIDLQLITGIKDFRSNPQVHIYPNPAQSQVILTSAETKSDVEVTLSNITGQVIHQSVHIQLGQNQPFIFERNNLPQGVYLMELRQNGHLLAREKVILAD